MQVYSNQLGFTNGICFVASNFKKVIANWHLKQAFVLTVIMFGMGFQAKSQCVDCGAGTQATLLNVDPNYQNSAPGDFATAGGRLSDVEGFSSFGFGGDPNINPTSVDAAYSFGFGQYAEIHASENSFSFGQNANVLDNDFSFAFGKNSAVHGLSTFSYGFGNEVEVGAESPHSLAFGAGQLIEQAPFSFNFGEENQIFDDAKHTYVFGQGLEVGNPFRFVVGWEGERFFEVNPDVTYSLSDAFGIGTDNPSHKLQVTGGIRLSNTTNAQAGAIRWTGTDFEGYNGSSWNSFTSGGGGPDNDWNINGTELYADKNVGIFTGGFQSTYELRVNGTIRTNNITTTSDARLKENVESLDNALDLVNKLEGVTYKFKEEDDMNLADDQQYGFIAQEVEKVLPELVSTPEEGYKSLEYQQFTPILTNAIQEQQKQIEEQQQTIEELKNRVAQLEAQVNDDRDNPEIGSRDATSGARLYDNAPNPFDTETTIRYEIEDGSNAGIQVYNMKGEQMKSFALEDGKEGAITISARTFEPGMYMYSLVAGGDVVDTKRMMITAGR